jgi:hypothetical protein
MYQGPPPAPPIRATPSLPDISTLAASIISSADRLFFISVAVSPSYKEWRLVRVVLDDSISLHPACLQDGRFLVEFYVCLPMIFATIALINAIGFNITRLKTSELLSTPHIHTSSARLTRLPPLLYEITYKLFDIGYI